jgi:FdhD protein
MSKLYTTYGSIQFKDGQIKTVQDNVTIEKALQISINNSHFAVVMQTPGDEINLATGLLYSEDIINKNTPIDYQIKVSNDENINEVNCNIDIKNIGDGYKSSRSLLSVSSCGICGKKDLDDLRIEGKKLDQFILEPYFIFKLQKKMQLNQPVFPITGSTHGAVLVYIAIAILY